MLQRILLSLKNGAFSESLGKALTAKDILVEQMAPGKIKWREMMLEPFDIVVLDRMSLPANFDAALNGIGRNFETPELVAMIEEENPNERARLIAAGCAAVLSDKVCPEMQASVIETILENRLNRMPVDPHFVEEWRPQLTDFCTKSESMKKFMKDVHRVIDQNVPLLVLGETGVGKEWLCRAIHNAGPRSGGSFVAVNCGALAENLIESELFGHERGAFTDAHAARRGCFEQAHNGAIFLDEIGEMPLNMQVKLLRVLQDNQIQRIGSEKTISVDVRLMAATNRDLEVEVEKACFRKDLFYRLSVITLNMPSLRQRREDIPTLVMAYIQLYQLKFSSHVRHIEQDALDALCAYDWPGNVRELSNIIERAVLLCDGDCITLDELPHTIRIAVDDCSKTASDSMPSIGFPKLDDNDGVSKPCQELYQMPFSEARKASILSFEEQYFRQLLQQTRGRVNEAARIAGINRRTLFDHLQNLGINKNDFKNQTSHHMRSVSSQD